MATSNTTPESILPLPKAAQTGPVGPFGLNAAAPGVQQGSLAGTTSTAAPAAPAPAAPAPIQPAQPAAPQQPQQPQQPTASNPFALSQVTAALQAQLENSNKLVSAKNLILKQLYGNPLTDAEKAQLDPGMQAALASGDRNLIDFNLRLINDQIAGKANSIPQTIQYLTQGYQSELDAIQKKREDTQAALKDYVAAGGDVSLYNKFLQDNYGIDTSALLPGGGSNAQGSVSYRTNNPGNIKWTGAPWQVALGATDSGIKAQDGGTFAMFPDLKAGQSAQIQLLQAPSYANLTFDQAMKRWSNNGYGAEVDPSIPANTKMSDLTPDQLSGLAQAMQTREGFFPPSAPSNAAPGTTGSSAIDSSTPGYATEQIAKAGNLTQAAIDNAALKYALTGTMPAIGLSSTGQGGLRKNAILNRAGELDAGGNIEANKAKLASLNTSLSQQTTYLNTMERSINTVDDNLKILQDAAGKVNKSDSPLINEWTNLAKQKVIGSGDLNAYKAAIQTVRNEYSNILARGGTVTDTVRGEAQTLIPDNITKAQLNQVLGVLAAEGANVKQEARNQVDSIANQISNILTPSTGGGYNNDYDAYLKAIGQ